MHSRNHRKKELFLLQFWKKIHLWIFTDFQTLFSWFNSNFCFDAGPLFTSMFHHTHVLVTVHYQIYFLSLHFPFNLYFLYHFWESTPEPHAPLQVSTLTETHAFLSPPTYRLFLFSQTQEANVTSVHYHFSIKPSSWSLNRFSFLNSLFIN